MNARIKKKKCNYTLTDHGQILKIFTWLNSAYVQELQKSI